MLTYQKIMLKIVFGGALVFLVAPLQGAWASGFSYSSGYYGNRGREYTQGRQYHSSKKYRHGYFRRHAPYKGYVKPYKHSHDHRWQGFTYSLPFGSKRVNVDGRSYRYHNGTFYKKCNKRGYDIVSAPYGAFVRYLPSKHRITYRYGKKYYRHKDTYY